jgi:hypothetical protein
MRSMADHYLRSIELLDEVAEIRRELTDLYLAGRRDPSGVAELHSRLGVCLKTAAIHAQLAEVQALQDVRMTAAS